MDTSDGEPAGAPPAGPLTWRESGWETWHWAGSEASNGPAQVHYIAAGPVTGPPVLLIHGFGASGFHWRRNVNALAGAGYRTYAVDLLGFGLSEKPVMQYNASVWQAQCSAFLEEVAGCTPWRRRAVVAGNSLGGFAALSTAALSPELVCGCVLLNAAGRFEQEPHLSAAELAPILATAGPDGLVQRETFRQAWMAKFPDREADFDALWLDVGKFATSSVSAQRLAEYYGQPDLLPRPEASPLESAGRWLFRRLLGAVFVFTKQKPRIRQVLRTVYPANPEAVDDELVESIAFPATAPEAEEVFYRIVSRNGAGPPQTVNSYLRGLRCSLLLLWGERDPWIVSAIGDRFERLARSYGKDVRRVSVDAGHCPHDENPAAVNAALLAYLAETQRESSAPVDAGGGQ